MALVVSNNTKLRKLIAYISASFHNDTYNLTETQKQLLENYLNRLTERIGGDNFPETIHTDVDCGAGLEDVAEIYAKNYHPYFATAVCLFGIVANLCNIAVLTRKDMISTPINRILTALAVADALVMVEYIPYTYYYYVVLAKKMDFPYSGAVYILFHTHFTQVLHTTSVCLNLTLAIWRYLALGYPERIHTLCSDSRCTLSIVLSYFLPVVLCIPTYVTLTIATREITENQTLFILYHTDLHDMFKTDNTLLKINFWIYAVLLKLLPCAILTVIISWLIRAFFKAKKRRLKLQSYNDIDNKNKTTKTKRRADRTTKMLVAVLLLFLLTEFPQGIFALLIGIKGKDLFLECYQLYGEIMDILALINGAINFILYCSMSRRFRTMFGQLFKIRVLGLLTPPPPPSDIHTTCV
ncbi:G-protein coupled receptor dmsr-1-like [Zophobas morio]|uniref:G-protein coupled receptor dmsr-1-like n=1 Tax=Zophobas morio TaxID=2755281 RepID=UPI003082C0FF